METEVIDVAPVIDARNENGVAIVPAPPPDARDSKGRFKPGWRGGTGRPLSHRAKMLKLIEKSITPDQVLACLKSLAESAASGDVQAARLLLEYSVGKPRPLDEDEEQSGPLYKVYIGIDEARI